MSGVTAADDAKEQIRARADLAEIVREHVRLRPQGRQLLGLCPFHSEKTPSFRVTPQTQTWHCFGCDRGGDVFKFVELIENTDFRGALELLAERTGVELARQSSAERQRVDLRKRILEINKLAQQYYEYVLWGHPSGEPGRRLLERRGVDEPTGRRFGLGFAPAGRGSLSSFLRSRRKSMADADAAGLVRRAGDFFTDRLIVPIRDERGHVLAFVGRTAGDDPRKYVNSPETAAYSKGRVLFALDVARAAIGKVGNAVLMEGQFDVITAHQFGIANAIATSGTALTEDQLRLLSRFTEEVVLCFDGDPAGKAAALRAIEQCAGAGLRCRVATVPGDVKDPDEFLRRGGSWDELAARAVDGWEFAIRDASAPFNLARPDDLDRAIGRVFEVLARVPDAAVREAYRLKTAEWLGVEARFLQREVDARPRVRRTAAAPTGIDGARPAPRRRLSVAEHLLSLVVAQPLLLPAVDARVNADDFAPGDRDGYLRISGTLRSAGAEGLRGALASFDEREQELIRRAWADPPPEADEEVIEELAWRLRLETLRAELRSVKSRLAEAEQRGDRDRVAVLVIEDVRLGRAVEALKNSRKGKSTVG